MLVKNRNFNKIKRYDYNAHLKRARSAYEYFVIMKEILNIGLSVAKKTRIFNDILNQLNGEEKKGVSRYIEEYITKNKEILSFKEVISIYSLLVMIGDNKMIVKEMLLYMKEHDSQLDYYYAPFTNSLFYISTDKQEIYDNYFLDRMEIMKKLKRYYLLKTNFSLERKKNHLVIITGQLLSYNHAPTKVTINYANHLRKNYPSLKIKIIVEDMFDYSPNELFFPYSYVSAKSNTMYEYHKKLLDDSIEIYYSNSNLNRKERLEEDIQEIISFKPEWILKVGAPESIISEQLYNYYPVASFSMGGAEYSESVDLAFGGHSEKDVLMERKSKGLSNDNYLYLQHKVGLEFPKSKNSISKSKFGFKKQDFVIVTVGNRLNTEIDKEFTKGIKNILDQYPHIKWLLIGLDHHNIIDEVCGDNRSQIKYVSYTNELANVYDICSVYANPFRLGGGFSVAMAMDAGIPVANIEGNNDANVYVPFGKAQKKETYFNYLEHLIEDKEFYNKEKEEFSHVIEENFGFKVATNQIMKFLEVAEKKFYNRMQNKIDV